MSQSADNDAPHTRVNDPEMGPPFCDECSRAVQDWVPWPCSSAQAVGEVCRHGVPLVSRVGGTSAYCATCDGCYAENPRYYADGLHLAHAHDWRHYATSGAAVERCLTCGEVRIRVIPSGGSDA